MKTLGIGIAAIGLVLAGKSAPCLDLAKIERRIDKEPAYSTKSPGYCLLVLGPEARTKVWLVLDGDTLFADRNSNGDLTEKDERFPVDRSTEKRGDERVKVASSTVGDILASDGKALLKDLTLRQWNEESYLAATPAGGRRQWAGRDSQGALRFSVRQQEAPIVHFNGPLTMDLNNAYTLSRGEKSTELYAVVGTPGLGKGTFASIDYSGIPADVHPEAEIEFPPPRSSAGGAEARPSRLKVSLDKRC